MELTTEEVRLLHLKNSGFMHMLQTPKPPVPLNMLGVYIQPAFQLRDYDKFTIYGPPYI